MTAPSNALAGHHGQEAPLKGYLLRSALVAALGGLLFGFDTAVISGETPFVFFAVMMVTQVFVVLKFYPETARIRLEEIEHRV